MVMKSSTIVLNIEIMINKIIIERVSTMKILQVKTYSAPIP